MYQVNVTSDPIQDQTLVLQDGTQIQIEMRYVPMQYMWVFDYVISGSFSLYGLRIVNNYNLLNQWRNQINFGMFVTTVTGVDPILQTDFSDGNASLFVLSASEVEQYTNFLTGVV